MGEIQRNVQRKQFRGCPLLTRQFGKLVILLLGLIFWKILPRCKVVRPLLLLSFLWICMGSLVSLKAQTLDDSVGLVASTTPAVATEVSVSEAEQQMRALSASSLDFVRLQSEFLAVLGIMVASVVIAMRRRARIALGYRR